MTELTRHIDQIRKLCATNKVRSLFVFGSILSEGFKSDSDIDLIVDIDSNDPLIYSDSYFNLKFQLEQLLNRKIDLLEQNTIQNPYLRRQIDETKVLIYG